MVFNVIQGWLDKSPALMEGVRGLIQKGISLIGLAEQPTFMLVTAAISFYLAFLWFKRWVAVSIFSRLSVLLNVILLAVIFYIVIVYV